MLYDTLIQVSEYIAQGLPLLRATEDAMLNYWMTQVQGILPQPTKEHK